MCDLHWGMVDKDIRHMVLKRQGELGHKDRRRDPDWRELVEMAARDVFTKLARIVSPTSFVGYPEAAKEKSPGG